MPEVVTVFRGDDGDLQRKLEEQARLMEKLESQVKKLKSEGKDTTTTFGGLLTEITKIGAGFGLWASGSDIMHGLINLANEYSESLRKVNEQLQQTQNGGAAFASMQPAGTVTARSNEARLLFGSLGISGTEGVNDAFRRMATLQGFYKGDFGAAKSAFRVEDRASDIGMSTDAVRQAMDVGIASGLTPEQAIGAAFSIQMQTGKSAETVARAGAAKGMFGIGGDSLVQGYAITGALPNILTDKQLVAAVAGLGALSNEDSKAWGRLGMSRGALAARGVNEGEMDMERLIAASGMSREQLERAGFKGSDLENLLLLSGRGETIRSLRGSLTPEAMGGALSAVEKNVFSDTSLQLGESIENRSGGSFARGTSGLNALLAREQKLQDQARLAYLETQGLVNAGDREAGGVGFWEYLGKSLTGFFPRGAADPSQEAVFVAIQEELKGVREEIKAARADLARTADSNEQMAADSAAESPNRTPQPAGGR